MDEFTKVYLNKLLEKEPEDITDEEMAFLKARRSYLTSDQKERFGIKTEEKTKKK